MKNKRADPTRRLRAVEASVSPEELTDALDDPSPEVVRVAIRRLVDLLGPGAAASLRARVFSVDLSLVADFTKALQRIGDSRILQIATMALEDQRSTRRLAAVRALGALADAHAVEPLRAALDDQVGGVRAAALDALAQVGPGAGAGIGADCARLVSDPVPHVRIAAVRAVARLVARPGRMLTPAALDQDRSVRLAVARHAGSLPEPSARALLADPDLRVREAAARAAGAREVGVVAVLLAQDSARDVRRAAAHALGAMQDERVADLLVPGLEDRDPLVRVAVLHALEQLLTKAGVVRRLCGELEGNRAERRRASLYALSRLEAPEAEPAVARAAADPDPEVRLALIHSAEALFRDPGPLMHYLAADPDDAVRNAAEMWLIRTTPTDTS
ncbi:MAG TPA: HEAT repeat domain-containing protein [Solirubrobacteraceae bacterium]|nr:HEAT repeat domain-containing protein [Solirubrobacteraceae bacterium]